MIALPSMPAVRERPILFSGAMVRAILAGTKTQTRRIVRSPHIADLDVFAFDAERGEWEGGVYGDFGHAAHGEWVRCPYGNPGDRLWVRESWCSGYARGCWGTIFATDLAFEQGARQHARGPHFNGEWRGPTPQKYSFRPSIHMPRWASRITLEVTGVRVERLQAISEEDAIAEGVEAYHREGTPNDPGAHVSARARFRDLWDGINGLRAAWSSDPWVWAVAFRRLP